MQQQDFWTSRPALTTIHQHARARRVAPWAVFGGIIARIIAATEPRVQLPPIVGGFGSLNLFVAIVGRSGQGKGASQAAASALLDIRGGTLFDTVSVGSGEGIAAAYVERGRDDVTSEMVVKQHAEAALFDVAEIDTLTALSGRTGSTLLAELRKVWSGERLGFQNRDTTRNLPVESHRYRAALIAGIQPTRASALLDDAGGGTPQRFLWLPATDPDAPSRAPQPPETLVWTMPGEAVLPTLNQRRTLRVCDEAWTIIDTEHVKRLRGQGDALDGHALLSRLKVAAALALFDERGDVSPEDWELAGVVMGVSDATRLDCQREISAAARAVNEYRATARAEASVTIADQTEIIALARCKERLVQQLSPEWMATSELLSKVTSTLRTYFDAAISELIGAEVIEVQMDKHRGRNRTRYRLITPLTLTEPSGQPVRDQNPQKHADLSPDSEALTESSGLTTDSQGETLELEEGTA